MITHNRDNTQKIAELNSIFEGLNDRGKESALTILRALNFAQAVMSSETHTVVETNNRQQVTLPPTG